MAEFPIGVLADRVADGRKTLEIVDEITDKQSGGQVQRRVTISGSDKWGLPTGQDTDVLLALMKLTNDKQQFRQREVPFSLYELRELLRWPNDGRYKARLRKSLLRLLGVTIAYENAFRRQGRWVSLEGFHLIDNVRLTNTVAEYDPDAEQLFKWNDVIVESMQANHRKKLDWDFYIGLEGTISKRLYRFLDKRWKLGRRWSYQLEPFCRNKLGMCGESYRPSDFRKKLWPAVEELMDRSVLSGIPRDDCIRRVGKGLYMVDFEKATKFRRAKLPLRRTSAPSALEQELLERDVKNAHELVASHSEKHIKLQIENFDDRIANGEPLGAGWLRSAIEAPNGYGFRADYQSAEQREAVSKEEEKRRSADRQQEAKAAAAFAYERQKVDEYLNSLTDSERMVLEEQALANNALFRGQSAEWSETLRGEAIIRHVRQLLAT